MEEEIYPRPQAPGHRLADPNQLEIKDVSLKSLFNFTKSDDIPILLLGSTLALISGGMKPTLTIFLGKIFDDYTSFGGGSISQEELLKNVAFWAAILTALGGATWFINAIFFSQCLLFGERQAKNVREAMFGGMLEKEMEWYDLRMDGISSLLVRIQTQVRELQTATSQSLGFFLENIASAIGALTISLVYSWKLTLVILASVPILILAAGFTTRKLEEAVETQKQNLTQASKYAFNSISAVDTIKSYNAQDHEVGQFHTAIKSAAEAYLVQANAIALPMGFMRFMTVMMCVQGFWYGRTLVEQGLGAGSVLTCFYSVLMAVQSVESMIPMWMFLSKGMSAGETLKHIQRQMENGRKITKMQGCLKPASGAGDIEVHNVTFSYPSNPGQIVLQNASFFFPGGETTFIIGHSGSGKSTIGNLLMKFYEPDCGEILIDGHSMPTLNIDWLRNKITLVQQQSVLFNETLFKNIAFGRRQHSTVTKDEVRAACQIALLQQTIADLPDGLDTVVGAGGNSMSGGQKQRVALSRSLLRNAPILILDEATSALDPVTRTLVLSAIREWRRGRTTIIITHDISQIMENDFVYILDQGRIVEEGYRNKLEGDPKGAFVSFLPHQKSESGDNVSLNREGSEDYSDAGPVEKWYTGEEPRSRTASRGVKRLSNFLGFTGELPGHSPYTTRRGSYDMAVTGAVTNELRTENAWKIKSPPRVHISQLLQVGSEVSPMAARSQTYLGSSIMNDVRTDNAWHNRPMPPIFIKPQYNTLNRTPTLPSPTSGRDPKSYAPSIGPLDSEEEDGDDFELVQLMGNTSVNSRSNALKLDGTRRPTHLNPEGPYPALDPASTARLVPVKYQEPKRPKTARKKPEVSMAQILGTVWPNIMWHDRLALACGFGAGAIHAGATPAFSYIFAQLLNTFYTIDAPGSAAEAQKWAFLTIGIAVTDGLSNYYMHWLLEYVSQVWVDTLRVEALKRILAQPRSWFDKERNSPGFLCECLDRNAEEMRNLLGRFAAPLFVAALMVFIAIVWAFTAGYKLTFVGLTSAPAVFIGTRLFEMISSRWESRTNDMAEKASRIFTETFSNIRVVRALTLENYFRDKHTKAFLAAYSVGKRRAWYSGFFFGLSDSTNSFVTALILYYGAVLVGNGEYSVSQIMLVITLLLFSSGNASGVMAIVPQISSSKTTASQILHLANMPSTASHESLGQRRVSTPLPIRLKNLSFTYPSRPSVEILHRINMEFKAGTCTALVGASGSGKSTIATLLLGLYPPNEPLHYPTPTLTFDGTSIFNCNISHLRSMIAIVSQTPVLFPTTIENNIVYGLRKNSVLRSKLNIEHAARQAGIHDFITSLPLGYDTVIGEGGQGLSGGQAQRVSIARALVRRPKMLIMDEATSALDVESAGIIRQTVKTLMRHEHGSAHDWAFRWRTEGMAIIVITHSVDMMRVADRIIMLDKGRVVEEGRFEELKAKRGSFNVLIEGMDR